MFFGTMQPNANRVVSYVPVIDINDDLVFYENCRDNNACIDSIELAPRGTPIMHRPLIRIRKEDAAHLFKAAVHGIMTHQSRTPPPYLAYQLWEYDMIKKGSSADEIWDAGQEFRGY
ncbi:Uncharacterised protein [uncultured archaeon]|nr:Uncharacterised protein [uncultured archaeon]